MRFPCVIASFIHSAAARFVCFTFYDYYCCSRRSCCCCRSCSCSCCCCALRSLNLCFMFEQSSKKKRKKTMRRTLSLFAAPLTAPALCSCATHSLSLSLCHMAFSNCQRQALEHKERTPPQPLQVDRGEKKVNLISSVCNNCPSPSLRLSFSAVSQRHVNKPSPANPRPHSMAGVAGAARLLDVVEYCL